jgi:hypothetical protein
MPHPFLEQVQRDAVRVDPVAVAQALWAAMRRIRGFRPQSWSA